ncbi:MAG TPA: hypothetical protein VNG53_05440, partial [Bacteroidia bacterium]|nr:hypothetical protein [Bacteroidia bacterium]
KTLNRQERFANLSYSSDLTLKQFALVMGIAFSFGFFNMWLVGLYVSWSVVIIYSIILYQYYFRWTDKGLKFQAEEQNKKEEKEQKKKEDDEARRKNICKNFYSPF